MKYILSFLLAVASLGSFVFYTQKQAETTQALVNERSFFKKFKKARSGKKLSAINDIPEIITYGVNLNIDVNQKQRDEFSEVMDQNQKLTAQCDVQTIYDEQNDEFDIAVSYSHVDRHDAPQLNEEQEEEGVTFSEDGESWSEIQKDVEVKDVEQVTNYFYLLKVNASSGRVNKLQIESGVEEDPFLTYATQQLINDIFPELRKGSYEKAVLEEDNMGSVEVDYTKEDMGNDEVAITKEYSSKDYKKLEIPALEDFESKLERVTIVEKSTGIVEEGATEYDFSLGDINDQGEENLTQGLGEAPEDDFEVLGKLNGGLKSNFWLVKKSKNDDIIAKEMYRYRYQAEFEHKRLAFEQKAEIVLGDGSEEQAPELIDFDQDQEVIQINDDEFYGDDQPTAFYDYEHTIPISEANKLQEGFEEKLSVGRMTFQEKKELAGVSILGKRVAVDFIYTGYTDTSNLKVQARVGNHPIATMMNYSFNNCKQSSNAKRQEKFITFFQATFPILGIVVVPVKAGGRFAWGYTTSVNTAPRFCQLNVQPYFQSSVYGEGSVSLAGLISAGIYAQGNFLDSALHFQATSAQGKSSASLSGNFKAIGFDMGATYTKISCSLKNIRTLEAVEEIEDDVNAQVLEDAEFYEDEEEINRRVLRRRWRKKFKKIAKPVRKVVHKAKKVANKAVKVAQTAYNVATSLHKICSTSKGSVKIASYHSKPKNFTLFNKSVNFGI